MRKAKIIEQKINRTSYVRKLVLEEKACPQCGKTFEGIRKQKFCSRACQKKADYERHSNEYRQARMERYRAEKKAAAGKT
jgi:endogenous inhibitor of DNA gyrase (YacG/DUF329 family)